MLCHQDPYDDEVQATSRQGNRGIRLLHIHPDQGYHVALPLYYMHCSFLHAPAQWSSVLLVLCLQCVIKAFRLTDHSTYVKHHSLPRNELDVYKFSASGSSCLHVAINCVLFWAERAGGGLSTND